MNVFLCNISSMAQTTFLNLISQAIYRHCGFIFMSGPIIANRITTIIDMNAFLCNIIISNGSDSFYIFKISRYLQALWYYIKVWANNSK